MQPKYKHQTHTHKHVTAIIKRKRWKVVEIERVENNYPICAGHPDATGKVPEDLRPPPVPGHALQKVSSLGSNHPYCGTDWGGGGLSDPSRISKCYHPR